MFGKANEQNKNTQGDRPIMHNLQTPVHFKAMWKHLTTTVIRYLQTISTNHQ